MFSSGTLRVWRNGGVGGIGCDSDEPPGGGVGACIGGGVAGAGVAGAVGVGVLTIIVGFVVGCSVRTFVAVSLRRGNCFLTRPQLQL